MSMCLSEDNRGVGRNLDSWYMCNRWTQRPWQAQKRKGRTKLNVTAACTMFTAACAISLSEPIYTTIISLKSANFDWTDVEQPKLPAKCQRRYCNMSATYPSSRRWRAPSLITASWSAWRRLITLLTSFGWVTSSLTMNCLVYMHTRIINKNCHHKTSCPHPFHFRSGNINATLLTYKSY